MQSQLVRDMVFSAATFRRCLPQKAAFVSVNITDLALTLMAVNLGLRELNPIIGNLLQSVPWLVMLKAVIPIVIAWLVPGKWLLPATGLSFTVIIWNLKELVLHLTV